MDTPINVFSNWVRSGKDEGMEKNHSSSVENMLEFATKELNNYSFIDISYNLSLASYEDRLYDFTDDVLSMNKIGKIPRQNTFQLDFGNDPNGRLYFDISLGRHNVKIIVYDKIL